MNVKVLAKELTAEADRLEAQAQTMRGAVAALNGKSSPTREKRDHAGALRAQRKRRVSPKMKKNASGA